MHLYETHFVKTNKEFIIFKCLEAYNKLQFSNPIYNNERTIFQSFQLKIINRILNCSYKLKKWQILQEDKCF